MQLFAETFLEPVLERDRSLPSYIYDEATSRNLLPSGEVLVEHVLSGETTTVTRADGESDDVDFDDEPSTITEARGEHDGWSLG